jgi:uncharacterized protein YndB with AHSA1/START domain
MKTNLLMNFTVDKQQNSIRVEREFAAPLEPVWRAWTEKDILDLWWAPKPWKARTKSMDFREGGTWLYAMVGPEGEEHWARADYKSITPMQAFSGDDAFCNPEGVNHDMPESHWNVRFSETDGSTVVNIEMTFDKPEHLEANLKMGFKEGLTAAMENLDGLLK